MGTTAQRSHTVAPEAASPVVPRAGAQPLSLRDYFAASPARTVTQAAALVVVLHAVVRGWAASRGWLFSDDLIFQSMATGASLTDPDYLLRPHNGHLMPGGFVLVWFATQLAPHGYWPIALSSVLLSSACVWVLFLVLRRLFGSRPAVLVPLAVGAFSTLTLPLSLWWAVSVNQLPQLLTTLLAVLLHLRYLETRSVRPAVGVAACLVLGLAFSERMLLVPPLLLLLTAWWFHPSPGPVRSLVGALRRDWRAWALQALVLVPYAGYYATAVPSVVDPAVVDPALALATLSEALTISLPSGVLGGPWSWLPTGASGAVPADPGWLRVTAALLVAVGVAATLLVRPRAARAWLVVATYLVGDALVLGLTRATAIGEIIGREYRYFTEFATVLPIGLGLALLPVVAAGAADEVRRPSATARGLDGWSGAPTWLPVVDAARRRGPAVVAGVVACYLLASTVAVVRYDTHWSDSPSRAWSEAAARTVQSRPQEVYLDTTVPERVQSVLTGPWSRASRVLRPVVPPERFLAPGRSAADVRVLDDSASSRPVALVDSLSSREGPEPDCGYRLSGGRRSVPLVFSTFPGEWVVRVAYLSAERTAAVLTVGGRDVPVVLEQGLGTLYTVAEGEIEGIRLSGARPDVAVCVTEVVVGRPSAVPAS